MFYKFLSVIILTFFAAANIVLAQTSGGAISGKLLDQNGAAISGATVKIRSELAEIKTAATDTNGEFSFSNLPSGE